MTLNTNGKIKPKTSVVNLLDCKELKTRREKIKHKWDGNIKCVTFQESSQDEAIQIGPKSFMDPCNKIAEKFKQNVCLL